MTKFFFFSKGTRLLKEEKENDLTIQGQDTNKTPQQQGNEQW